MTTEEISEKINSISTDLDGSDWGFAFLQCFQGTGSKLPKSTFDRVKQGSTNFAEDKESEILWKKRIYFRWVEQDVRSALTEAKGSALVHARANKPMFVLIASPDEIAAHDIDQGEDLVIPRDELSSHTYFFLPFAGKKKVTVSDEALEVDVKATRKMAVFFDEIRKDNPEFESHDLNVFLARLLFCFFAEDTSIFQDDLFTTSLASHSDEDGSDLANYISTLFRRFATEDASGFREEFRKFEYVNGGLFENEHPVPTFTKKSRKLLIENGEMDWQSINPDIFGSMFQSIVDPEKRHELGMHYTSRENIMKVINPLFLNSLREDFETAKASSKKLEAFHHRLSEIKIFDPACGSGNFLILAYEKLRELEMDVLEAKGEIAELFPRISINQFHGIEIDDFAHELAVLALWIKEHQMNLSFHERFQTRPDALPLREGAHIVRDNATRCNWDEVCPRETTKSGNTEHVEIYVLGNPPYLGARSNDFSASMKEDRAIAIGDIPGVNEIDYFACWLFKAEYYIKGFRCAAAFVSTNSICQGEQAALIWHPLIGGESTIEIAFAYTSFKWTNQAVGNAGVTCVITGIQNCSQKEKTIFSDGIGRKVKSINVYLTDLPPVWVRDQGTSISGLPAITYGNMPNDGGQLAPRSATQEELVGSHPDGFRFIRSFSGADEFLYKRARHCLWIGEDEIDSALAFPEIKRRVESCRDKRQGSSRPATRLLAKIPYRFGEVRHQDTESIIFPRHSSEKREYIPLGFLDSSTIIGDSALAIYNATPWIFGVLSSKMHMEWAKLIAGRLETRVRYSSFVYNNFPIPPISDVAKEAIEEAVFKIIDIREGFHEMTYADMYDPVKMPEKLLEAHRALDVIVDRCYRTKQFSNANERLGYLITLYKQITKQN